MNWPLIAFSAYVAIAISGAAFLAYAEGRRWSNIPPPAALLWPVLIVFVAVLTVVVWPFDLLHDLGERHEWEAFKRAQKAAELARSEGQ